MSTCVEITKDHASVLAAIHGEAFTEAWDADAFASALDQPGAFGFIATEDDEPLGFALLRAALFDGGGGEAEVLSIATRPQARRRGAARQLMQAALERARTWHIERVFLEVAEDNSGARGLYQSLGFTQVGRRKAYYARAGSAPKDALIMALDLAA